MSLNLRGVHVFQKIPGQSEYRLKETHPAMRIAQGMDVLYIQDGQVYDAGGGLVEKYPEWFLSEIQKTNPVALREVGFKLNLPK